MNKRISWPARLRRVLPLFLLLAIFTPVLEAAAGPVRALPLVAGPALSVDVAASRHAISPYIYGINSYAVNPTDFDTLEKQLKLPVNRWGGNAATRFNYLKNAFNSGLDNYFEGYPNTGNVPPGQPSELEELITRDLGNGTNIVVQVPLIGYVEKDGTPNLCGFSIAKYGPQTDYDHFNNTDCGNGISAITGQPIQNNNPLDTSRTAPPLFTQDMVNFIKGKYGAANNGGVKFYELDNEPSDWWELHRDVHPGTLSYDELRDKTYAYAPVVKAADPSALTVGPSNFGYYVYEDSQVPNDKAAHGNVGFSEWYLQQMKAYEDQHGVRILDYFDQHYYEENVSLMPAGDAAFQALRLRSTRSLWDPTYYDESWISQANGFPPIQLIPTFRSWVVNNYPGTKTAITEYNWGALDHINGALAQADVLGIFGREQLDLATLWPVSSADQQTYNFAYPLASQPGAYAFRMFRNYDGAGSMYGDTWVQSASSDQGQLAIYGAQRSSDNVLTLVIINKTANDLTSTLTLSNFNPSGTAKVYRYSAANLGAIVAQPDQAVGAGGFTTTYPANSITTVVIPQQVYPPLVVKLPTDNGTNTADSLTAALTAVHFGQEIDFQLNNNAATIQLSGASYVIPRGAKLVAACNARITLDATGSAVPVLQLSGQNHLEGLIIGGFNGPQLLVPNQPQAGGNTFKCVTVQKTIPLAASLPQKQGGH